MQRSSIIATVIAAGGILIAGSVASVAVINAASLTPHDSETVSVVAAGAPDTSPTQSAGALADDDAAGITPSPTATPTASIPALVPEDLPVLPDVSSTPSATASRKAGARQSTAAAHAASPTRAAQSGAQPTKSPRPSRSASPSASTQAITWISADAARSIVLKAINGGTVQAVEKTSRAGYRAWAVRVARHDGSIVTGYVEASTGVIFDWVVNQAAPTPSPAATTTTGTGTHGSEDGHDGARPSRTPSARPTRTPGPTPTWSPGPGDDD